MEMVLGLMTIAIAWILMVVLEWVWLKPKKLEKWLRQHGFSGNSYRLLHGDIKDRTQLHIQAASQPISISDSHQRRILPYDYHILQTYGKKSFIWKGPTPSINITDPKLIKELLQKNDIYQKPQKSPLHKWVVTGMATYEGQQWAKVRKIVNPAFHLLKLKDMFPSMYISCNNLITKWKKSLLSDQAENEIEICPDIHMLTADVISRTAFGSSYEDGRKIFELIKEQMKNMGQNQLFSFIPGWRFLPTVLNRRMRRNYRETRGLIEGIINRKEELIRLGEEKTNNLLRILIGSNHKERVSIGIEQVIEECKLFYLAGQETTSSLLIWTMVLLSIHQDWQKRAREEVFQVFGTNKPKFDDLNNLKLISGILYEALRLYPPAPVTERTSNTKTKLGDIEVRPSIVISIPIIMVHHDREYWGDDVEEFNPNRFSNGILKASKNNEVSLFPFGWGPRVCIGQNFALLEAKLALSLILQNFSFELSSSYVHAPIRHASIQPQFGAPLILHQV